MTGRSTRINWHSATSSLWAKHHHVSCGCTQRRRMITGGIVFELQIWDHFTTASSSSFPRVSKPPSQVGLPISAVLTPARPLFHRRSYFRLAFPCRHCCQIASQILKPRLPDSTSTGCKLSFSNSGAPLCFSCIVITLFSNPLSQ